MPSIPKPFRRPSVAVVDTSAQKKEWRNVPLSFVSVGDLIAERGLVEHVSYDGPYVTVRTSSGAVLASSDNPTVFAFVAAV